jgi:ribosomal protein S18 acetylase RimI-like enzyme
MQTDIEIEKTTWLSQVIIRQLCGSDLAGLEWDGVYTHFRRVYSEAYRRAQSGFSVLWVAEHPEAGLIGQVFIQLICDRPELADGCCRAYLYSFRIRPEYRCMGLGTRMLQVVHTDLKERGYQTITLNVAKDNLRAQKLYEKHGYQVVAHEPGIWSYPDEKGVWHKVNEPAWRMEKTLRKE